MLSKFSIKTCNTITYLHQIRTNYYLKKFQLSENRKMERMNHLLVTALICIVLVAALDQASPITTDTSQESPVSGRSTESPPRARNSGPCMDLCVNCKGCSNCKNCQGCVNSTGCINCRDCVNCHNCWNSIGLTNCYNP